MVKLLLRIFTVLALCMGLGCYAQLPDFNLSVTPTGQTCLGNGALSFTVSGNTPQATIEYAVYLLPNTTTPVVTVTTATALNLVSGSYMVIATQSLNGQSNTATADATIEDYTQPLAYTLQLTPLDCQFQGAITVNITSGVAESYEILSGPVTVPAQSSNVFSNLPVGQYQVRVFDICGNAVVVTAQLVQQQTIDLEINYPTETLLTCTTMSTSLPYYVEGPGNLAYPLTCKFTVHPPGNGAPVIVTQIIPSGANFGNAVATLPFYGGPQYTYDLEIKDACNHTYYRPANYVNKVFNVTVNQQSQSCGNYYLSCQVNNAICRLRLVF